MAAADIDQAVIMLEAGFIPEAGSDLLYVLQRIGPLTGALASALSGLAQWWPGRGLDETVGEQIEAMAGLAAVIRDASSSAEINGLILFLSS